MEVGKGKTKVSILGNGNPLAVTIGSFETLLFSTYERVNMPEDIVGRFDLKVGYGLDGLVLQVGPQVEPGYHGPLFGALTNTSGSPKVLKYKEEILAIEFSRLAKKPSKVEHKTVATLEDFITKQTIDFERLAKPNVVMTLEQKLNTCREQHDDAMAECRTDHGLMHQAQDNELNRKGNRAQIWQGKMTLPNTIIAVAALCLAIITLWLTLRERPTDNQTLRAGDSSEAPISSKTKGNSLFQDDRSDTETSAAATSLEKEPVQELPKENIDAYDDSAQAATMKATGRSGKDEK